MSIGLRDLKNVKKQSLDEHRLREALVADVLRVVGPRIQTERRSIRQICDDVLMVTEGVSLRENFRPSVLARLGRHESPQARRLAARFAEGALLEGLSADKDVNVLTEVVRRVPLETAKKIVRRNRHEDGLRFIVEDREVVEVEPQSVESVLDMDPSTRREIETRSHEDDVLDDFWYEEMARNLVETYGNTMETNWIRIAVNQYAASINSMMGVPVDVPKLLHAVNEIIAARDEQYIDYHNVLKVTVESLERRVVRDELELVVEEQDEVEALLEANLTTRQTIETCERLFEVKSSPLTRSVKGALLAEELTGFMDVVPSEGVLPTSVLRESDEHALDAYVTAWSTLNAPLTLSWASGADERIEFTVTALGAV